LLDSQAGPNDSGQVIHYMGNIAGMRLHLNSNRGAEIHQISGAGSRFFYGWWIVAAAFLNLFFTTGFIYYGFPVFYPAFVAALDFTRAQVGQGFLLGFIAVGLPFGLLACVDR
jgi:hypothetical protein